MNKIFLIIVLSLTIYGCNFDSEMEYDIRYPATLKLKNASGKHVDLESIYSTLETEGGFAFQGGPLPDKSDMEIRISTASFDIIKAGQFELVGRCGEIKEWQKPGAQLQREAVENETEWKVTVTVTEC